MKSKEICGTPKEPNEDVVNNEFDKGFGIGEFVRVRRWHVLLAIGVGMLWGLVTGTWIAHILSR